MVFKTRYTYILMFEVPSLTSCHYMARHGDKFVKAEFRKNMEVIFNIRKEDVYNIFVSDIVEKEENL